MLRKLFRKHLRLVEVADSSSQKKVMSHDQYISKTIAERRNEAELMRLGISAPSMSDHRAEQIMRRWIS